MRNISLKEAPFLITILIAALGWQINSYIDAVSADRMVAYSFGKYVPADVRTRIGIKNQNAYAVEMLNPSRSKGTGEFTVTIRCESGVKCIKRKAVVTAGTISVDANADVADGGRSASATLNLSPGASAWFVAVLDSSTETSRASEMFNFSEDKNPDIRLSKICSLEVLVVRNWLNILVSLILLLFVVIVVWAFQRQPIVEK